MSKSFIYHSRSFRMCWLNSHWISLDFGIFDGARRSHSRYCDVAPFHVRLTLNNSIAPDARSSRSPLIIAWLIARSIKRNLARSVTSRRPCRAKSVLEIVVSSRRINRPACVCLLDYLLDSVKVTRMPWSVVSSWYRSLCEHTVSSWLLHLCKIAYEYQSPLIAKSSNSKKRTLRKKKLI